MFDYFNKCTGKLIYPVYEATAQKKEQYPKMENGLRDLMVFTR